MYRTPTFSEGDIKYLRSLNKFDEEFFDYLRDFHFTGSIYAVKEGTPVFPNEPLITIRAKFIEAQLIETLLLVNCKPSIIDCYKS